MMMAIFGPFMPSFAKIPQTCGVVVGQKTRPFWRADGLNSAECSGLMANNHPTALGDLCKTRHKMAKISLQCHVQST